MIEDLYYKEVIAAPKAFTSLQIVDNNLSCIISITSLF